MKVLVFDDMNCVTDQEVARMLPLVSPGRCEQALRYKHTLGQFCCLKSWLMVQEAVENYELRITNYELRITNYELGEWQYNEHGKPYLRIKNEKLKIKNHELPYFNISHCKEGIAVVVDAHPVGIDIEGIRRADRELIERTMNEKEQAEIFSARDSNRCFTRLWTRKEAVLKCIGTGIEGFEPLQQALTTFEGKVQTIETDRYIYSIATTT